VCLVSGSASGRQRKPALVDFSGRLSAWLRGKGDSSIADPVPVLGRRESEQAGSRGPFFTWQIRCDAIALKEEGSAPDEQHPV
jgi:hypothetical protein